MSSEAIERIAKLEERTERLLELTREIKDLVVKLQFKVNDDLSAVWDEIQRVNREIVELKSPHDLLVKILPPTIGVIVGIVINTLLKLLWGI